MTDHSEDYEELRPLGEATHVPDEQTPTHNSGTAHCQRLAGVDADYPDDLMATTTDCPSCGASIPASLTKCRFCLTNHLDPATDDQDSSHSERDLLHVVHTLVEAPTFYGAAAKGAASATLLAQSGSDCTVKDCQPIYDLDDDPAAQLLDQWPALPPAARVSSEIGGRVLAAARDRTVWTDSTQSCCDDEHSTFLYDETGTGILDEEYLESLLKDADDDIWLVPAIALQESVDEPSPESPQHKSPTRTELNCWECDRDTTHRFRRFVDGPSEEWPSQPMWKCQVCDTPQYGPEPEANW